MSVGAAKQRFIDYRKMLYDLEPGTLADGLDAFYTRDANIRLPHPLGDVDGATALQELGYEPLLGAIPDLERRDYISVGGMHDETVWIGTGGYYTGVFERPFLDIPPTRHVVSMRYMEFFAFDGERIKTARLLWDIPALMMQADAWPMSPSLGVEWHVPGPATLDGVINTESDETQSAASLQLVEDMVAGLERFGEGGAGAMNLEQFWHPKMNWYGPAGIGSMRRLSGFRNWHQIPFLSGIPDRSANTDDGDYDCYFGDGDYVAFCGWPAIDATVTGDGWMGIAPSGKKLKVTSLDFWRCENGLLRENWVLIDILDIWHQLGVDVLRRMRETTFARQSLDFKP